MLDKLKKKINDIFVQSPSPEAIKKSIAEGQVWKSIFRHWLSRYSPQSSDGCFVKPVSSFAPGKSSSLGALK